MQASDQLFLSSDGRSWTARITVEGCASESEALAAVGRATRAALGNADDEADAVFDNVEQGFRALSRRLGRVAASSAAHSTMRHVSPVGALRPPR